MGWLSFNISDMAGISGVIQPNLNESTNVFSGHGYFLAGGNVGDDGWLGLISLSSVINPIYNVKLNSGSYEIDG